MHNLIKKISNLTHKIDRRTLIRLSVIVVIAGVALGAMQFFGTSKPVMPVVKVSSAKTRNNRSRAVSNSDKAEIQTEKVDPNLTKVNIRTGQIDTVPAKTEIDHTQTDENLVEADVDIAQIDVNIVETGIYPERIDVNLIETDANDVEAETTAVDANAIDTNFDSTEDNTEVNEIQSLVFMKNMDIQEALHLLAGNYRRNIVPSSGVKGQLAFENLYEVTFDEAMEAILGTDFRYEEKGNLIKVYPADKGEMVHKVFVLYYINAADAKKLVQQVLSDTGKIEVTTAAQTGVPAEETISSQVAAGDATAMNDTLIIYDYPEHIEMAERVIAVIDIRPKQVMIEATILSATLTEGMQFGIDWQTLRSVVVQELADLTQGTQEYFRSSASSARTGSSSLAGGLTVGFVHDDVAGFIRAVEEVTDVTVLANPKILAVNKQLGQIYIGKKIAYQSQTTQTDTSTTEQVQFLDTGTKLSFRPYIGNDGYIRIDIHPKDSSATLRSSGSTTLPDETSAELVTNIIVKDNQTIVIGGLFRESITTVRTQIPIAGDLPIIGALFRGMADEVKREEVIVLLTPHIITDPNQVEGRNQMYDVQHKILGARDELQWTNKVRRANEYYDRAAEYYLQGDYTAALKNLNAALKLYPAYLEAIRLKELIIRELSLKRLKTATGR